MAKPNPILLPLRDIANERVKLTPFVPERHAAAIFAQSVDHPELYAHMPFGPFRTAAELAEFWTNLPLQYAESATYTIIDKTRRTKDADQAAGGGEAVADADGGVIAGMISYVRTSAAHLSTEIGGVLVLPAFHGTHVATNASGLLLRHALARAADGGLGLRRVQWLTSTMNGASQRLAQRLGFQHEAVLRWHMVFRGGRQAGKIGNGRPLPPGSDEGDLGRDTIVLSVCWEDWEQGTRELVERAMARTK